MSQENAELLARISAFDIDGGNVALPFAARLARDNGWARAYAERVISQSKCTLNPPLGTVESQKMVGIEPKSPHAGGHVQPCTCRIAKTQRGPLV